VREKKQKIGPYPEVEAGLEFQFTLNLGHHEEKNSRSDGIWKGGQTATKEA